MMDLVTPPKQQAMYAIRAMLGVALADGELHEQEDEVPTLDRHHPARRHHLGGAGRFRIGKAPQPFGKGVGRYR